MSDLLLIAGLASLVYANFLVDPTIGFAALGLALVFLSIATKGVKIPRPRIKFRKGHR